MIRQIVSPDDVDTCNSSKVPTNEDLLEFHMLTTERLESIEMICNERLQRSVLLPQLFMAREAILEPAHLQH